MNSQLSQLDLPAVNQRVIAVSARKCERIPQAALGKATAALLVGIGLAATYCSIMLHAMGHFEPTALVLVAVILMFTAVPRPAAAGISPEVRASLPALTSENFAFDQTEIRVRAGEMVALRLENADQAYHGFDLDEFGVHAPMPSGESSLALFRADQPGTYTFYCAPHHDEKTGQGMKGTLIVEP